MKGDPKVLEELNRALSAELSAIVQYIVHSEMCDNWGYKRLASEIKKQAIEEMGHAEKLIERILFFDGEPKVDIQLQPRIGASVPAQIENDLDGELEAVRMYNNAAKICYEAGDNGSRELFEELIKDEEEHVDFLEAQQQMIKDMGLENYLAQQSRKSD